MNNEAATKARHCERSEAISKMIIHYQKRLFRSFLPLNDGD
jgi:hypothetical protein